MKFELDDLKGYVIILISVSYASYTGYLSLLDMWGNIWIASIASIVLSIVAHLYLAKAVRFVKHKLFDISQLLAFILCGVVCTLDITGAHHKAEADHIISLSGKQTKEQNLLKNELQELQSVVNKNVNHTEKGKTNYAMYNTYRKYIKRVEQKENELSKMMLQHQSESKQAKTEAKIQESKLIGLSVVLILVSILVIYDLEKKPIENAKFSHKDIEPKKEISHKKYWENITELSTKDRLNRAVKFIQETRITDHRELMNKFRLNAQQTKQAKNLANISKTGFQLANC